MEILGSVSYDHPLVAKPTGLEELDYEEILRLRFLGMLSGEPKDHFLGGSSDATFGEYSGELGERWKRVKDTLEIGKHREDRLWRDAYHDIGLIGSYLGLPSYVRDEMTRIYANLRKRGGTVRAGISIEKVLAKIAYLACVIHRVPRPHQDLERGIMELYGHGIGRVFPPEFIKVLNTRRVRFGVESKNGRRYLYAYRKATLRGIRVGYRSLGQL